MTRLAGSSVVSDLTPHLIRTARKAPQARKVGLAALAVGLMIPPVLAVLTGLAVGPTLLLMWALALGGFFAGRSATNWLFPPLELLPDATTKTRWEHTKRAIQLTAAVLLGIASIWGLILSLQGSG